MKAKFSQMVKMMMMIILVSTMTVIMTPWLRLKVHSQPDTIQMELKVMTMKAVAVTGQSNNYLGQASFRHKQDLPNLENHHQNLIVMQTHITWWSLQLMIAS